MGTSSGRRNWKRKWNGFPNYRKRPASYLYRRRKGEAMSCHSEETWESFDALWRRIQELSRQVRELETRLGAVESERATPAVASEITARAIYESEVSR